MAKNGDPFNHIGGLDVDSMLIWIGIYSVSVQATTSITSLFFHEEVKQWAQYFKRGNINITGMEENPRSSSCGSTIQVRYDIDLNRFITIQDSVSSGPLPLPGYSSAMVTSILTTLFTGIHGNKMLLCWGEQLAVPSVHHVWSPHVF